MGTRFESQQPQAQMVGQSAAADCGLDIAQSAKKTYPVLSGIPLKRGRLRQLASRI